jgi:ribosomal protein L7Ae-like RNA K-turn-binding protein
MKRMAREIAEAHMAVTNELPARFVKPTRSNMLIDVAKKLQRLQTRAAKLRKYLKATTTEIRHQKRTLKALAHEIGRGE